jgi:hypothetical protein
MAAAHRRPELHIRRAATPQLDINVVGVANAALMQIKGEAGITLAAGAARCRTGRMTPIRSYVGMNCYLRRCEFIRTPSA